MTFWDMKKPDRPTGVKDPRAILDFPVDFSGWLHDLKDSYDSHTIETSGGIECIDSREEGGVIIPIISGGTVGEMGKFTVCIHTVEGRVDYRSFYLKIKER
jgi:hypothetical protein